MTTHVEIVEAFTEGQQRNETCIDRADRPVIDKS